MGSIALRSVVLSTLALALAACNGAAPSSATPQGRVIHGVTADNRLATFGSENPAASLSLRAFTGLMAGETIVGFDFEPGNTAQNRPGGVLVAISSMNRILTVNPATGAVTAVGSAAFEPALRGTSFGVDFNPVPNRVRVHTNDEQNLRLNQATGAMVDANPDVPGIQEDGTLAYAVGDVSAGTNPSLVGTAYSNSFANATMTTLFAIDSGTDRLVLLPSPNNGQITTVGALGVNTTDDVGFDIDPANGTAFATLTTSGANTSGLYTVDLNTGQAMLKSNVGVVLRGIAVAP